MPLNRACIGKQYAAVTEVTAAGIEAYARACNETNPRYFAGASGIIAPPMFAVVVTWIPVVAAITDPELGVDFIRLLHSRQEMEFFAPIRPGDQIAASGRIAEIETGNSGESLVLELDAANQAGSTVAKLRFTALIRARRRAGAREGTQQLPPANALKVRETIALDQTTRYAEASGDRNPIHVDPAVAKMAGLPGVIVHGLCTMAFACRAVIEAACGSEPRRLRRLSGEFSRPVFPGDSITTSIWRMEEADGRGYRFETANEEGVAVMREGVAEVEE